MKRFSEPAFGEKNRHISFWIIKLLLGYLLYFFFMYPEDVMVHKDRDRGLAVADARLRDATFKRMEEACFTRSEIKDYWYDQGFWEFPLRLLVIIRGREALCGGRGMCRCKSEIKAGASI